MPIVSKYSNERVEKITQELINVLAQASAKPDLALMCLGNTITDILTREVPEKQRKSVAENFSIALNKSIK
jgi:hypothetical protein